MVLRTRASHDADCKQLTVDPVNAHVTGVYRDCSLSQLKYFSIPESVCPDSMHDCLEGCLQYELKLFLRQVIIVDKLVSLRELNNRILSFSYGTDNKNKPQPISLDRLQSKEKKLGMNASQCWCFARYFCLLVGDLVDGQYAYLALIHILLDIIDILFAPKLTLSMTYRLEELISSHHELFHKLFPADSIIPKQHFLIHYPAKIRNLGPCVQYWCMRFESKHASAKEFCHLIRNFRNICKSIAYQQQMQLCVDWMAFNQSTSVDVGPGTAVLPCTLSVPGIVFEKVGIPLFEETYIPKYVRINGSKYTTNCIVVLAVECDLPVFGQIQLIAYAAKNVTFVVQKLHTLTYDTHLHAYEVSGTDELTAVCYHDLVDWHPLSTHVGFGNNRSSEYVVLKYELLAH